MPKARKSRKSAQARINELEERREKFIRHHQGRQDAGEYHHAVGQLQDINQRLMEAMEDRYREQYMPLEEMGGSMRRWRRTLRPTFHR